MRCRITLKVATLCFSFTTRRCHRQFLVALGLGLLGKLVDSARRLLFSFGLWRLLQLLCSALEECMGLGPVATTQLCWVAHESLPLEKGRLHYV